MTASALRMTRKKLGYTQVEMAEKMGLSLISICFKEQGRRPITKRDEMILKTIKPNKQTQPVPQSETLYRY